MPGHKYSPALYAALLFASLISCASVQAPKGWLPDPGQVPSSVFGGWMQVKTDANEYHFGELLAVGSDTVFILNDSLIAVAKGDIKSARLVAYQSNADGVGALAFPGTLMTLTNGIFLIFTAPMWWIGVTSAGIDRSFDPIVDFPRKQWEQFIPFARFPQGLPRIDRSEFIKRAR
jgi:hypothetical protein